MPDAEAVPNRCYFIITGRTWANHTHLINWYEDWIDCVQNTSTELGVESA